MKNLPFIGIKLPMGLIFQRILWTAERNYP